MTMVGMRSRSRSIKQRLCAVNTKPMKIKTAWLHQQRHESTSERTNAWTKSSRAKPTKFRENLRYHILRKLTQTKPTYVTPSQAICT